MQDIQTRIAQLRRPKLLIEAARAGAGKYRREHHFLRLVKATLPARHGAAIMKILEEEARLDSLRREADASYSVQRHVGVLIALMGEFRLFKENVVQPVG
ncbi:hypothetical protein SAMN05421688_0783 [Poseidonocella pacifica]|uniref:Uncharacterized protein n=1 Tax=Poseidonocella pacifica TaxID=871651 RepID=A0A1I0VM53_9RHOB|nr:DUF6477 family protein [Poseidonocella pacifica]SFA77504.1 hypothetical protein SAMN05421688_0783 [Poseidonocella pacifica]